MSSLRLAALDPYTPMLSCLAARPALACRLRLQLTAAASQPAPALTVGPAKLAGADHVHNVQEAIVRLELSTLLAQLHGASGQ